MRSKYLAVAALATFTVTACSDSTGTSSRPITLSFSTQANAAAASQAPNLDITISVGANTLVITKAQVVLRKMELKQNAATDCPDDDDSPSVEDCEEVKVGPMLVDLPLAPGTSSTTISAAVPEGTYREIELQIHRPTNNNSDAAFVAANPTFANASIRLEGTYNGTPFVFTSAISQSIELEFDPPVVINADNKNITVNFDLSKWFVVGGQVIDPATANPGQPNEQAVSQNIKASLHAFDDDDHDGRDDD
jgi:hypothetical protein